MFLLTNVIWRNSIFQCGKCNTTKHNINASVLDLRILYIKYRSIAPVIVCTTNDLVWPTAIKPTAMYNRSFLLQKPKSERVFNNKKEYAHRHMQKLYKNQQRSQAHCKFVLPEMVEGCYIHGIGSSILFHKYWSTCSKTSIWTSRHQLGRLGHNSNVKIYQR